MHRRRYTTRYRRVTQSSAAAYEDISYDQRNKRADRESDKLLFAALQEGVVDVDLEYKRLHVDFYDDDEAYEWM